MVISWPGPESIHTNSRMRLSEMEAEMKHTPIIVLIATAVAVIFLPGPSLPTYGEVTGSPGLVEQLTMLFFGPVILTFERVIRLLGQVP